MHAGALLPTPYSKCSFDKKASASVPCGPGCYAICRSDGFIFYIGQSVNLRSRMRRHLDNPEKTRRTAKNGVASVFYYREYPRDRLDLLENTWIQAYRNEHCGALPLFNKVAAPCGI